VVKGAQSRFDFGLFIETCNLLAKALHRREAQER